MVAMATKMSHIFIMGAEKYPLYAMLWNKKILHQGTELNLFGSEVSGIKFQMERANIKR